MALTADIGAALEDFNRHMRKSSRLLRGSRKNGKPTDQAMSVRAVGARVKILGRDILGSWDMRR